MCNLPPLVLDVAEPIEVFRETTVDLLGWIVGILAAFLVIGGAVSLIIVLAVRSRKRKNTGK
ncbi:MAG: hypothetical protein ACOX17_10090 [Christensenellales bacterium]|jgi:hypothetical protein